MARKMKQLCFEEVREGYYWYKITPNLHVLYGFPTNAHAQAIFIY